MTPKQAYKLNLENPEEGAQIDWGRLKPPLVTVCVYPQRPSDDIELCTCENKTEAMSCGHVRGIKELLENGSCPLEGVRDRQKTYDKAKFFRDRAWSKLMDLQDPKAARRDLREYAGKAWERAVGGPHANDYACSRYLVAMGERPLHMEVKVQRARKNYDGKLEAVTLREFHATTCGCAPCLTALQEIGTRGFQSSGEWTCGCNILGPGEVEAIQACKRHERALEWHTFYAWEREVEAKGGHDAIAE